MIKEFKRAKDAEFIKYFKEAILPKSFIPHKKPFEDGADWAYKWCQDKIEQAYLIQRSEGQRVIYWQGKINKQQAIIDRLKEALEYAIEELEDYSKDDCYHNSVAVDTTKSLADVEKMNE